MKAQYRVNPDLLIEIEGATQKDLFKEMALVAEIFGKHWLMCGKCKDKNYKPMPAVRVNNDNQYYELRCTKPGCGAVFSFGQKKDMKTLFPQTKFPKKHPQAGSYKPDSGWMVWKSEQDDEEAED